MIQFLWVQAKIRILRYTFRRNTILTPREGVLTRSYCGPIFLNYALVKDNEIWVAGKDSKQDKHLRIIRKRSKNIWNNCLTDLNLFHEWATRVWRRGGMDWIYDSDIKGAFDIMFIPSLTFSISCRNLSNYINFDIKMAGRM